MFNVGKSFFSKILSKLNIKTIAPLCLIPFSISVGMEAVKANSDDK